MTKNYLPRFFKEEKAIAAVSLLLRNSDGSCDKYWLNKVMYYIERQSLILNGQPMFYDSLFSVKYGPIVSAINDAIDNTAYPFDEKWNKHFALEGNTVRLLEEANYEVLSDSEENIILDAGKKFWGWAFPQLKRFFHDLPEHTDTTSRIDIEYADILISSGIDEKSIQDALETISYFNSLESTLSCEK